MKGFAIRTTVPQVWLLAAGIARTVWSLHCILDIQQCEQLEALVQILESLTWFAVHEKAKLIVCTLYKLVISEKEVTPADRSTRHRGQH